MTETNLQEAIQKGSAAQLQRYHEKEEKRKARYPKELGKVSKKLNKKIRDYLKKGYFSSYILHAQTGKENPLVTYEFQHIYVFASQYVVDNLASIRKDLREALCLENKNHPVDLYASSFVHWFMKRPYIEFELKLHSPSK